MKDSWNRGFAIDFLGEGVWHKNSMPAPCDKQLLNAWVGCSGGQLTGEVCGSFPHSFTHLLLIRSRKGSNYEPHHDWYRMLLEVKWFVCNELRREPGASRPVPLHTPCSDHSPSIIMDDTERPSKITVYTKICKLQLFVIPQTVAHRASLSMGFSRQAYWSGALL